MATYTCNACGLAECTIGISRDEVESAKLIHTATCPVYGDSMVLMTLTSALPARSLMPL